MYVDEMIEVKDCEKCPWFRYRASKDGSGKPEFVPITERLSDRSMDFRKYEKIGSCDVTCDDSGSYRPMALITIVRASKKLGYPDSSCNVDVIANDGDIGGLLRNGSYLDEHGSSWVGRNVTLNNSTVTGNAVVTTKSSGASCIYDSDISGDASVIDTCVYPGNHKLRQKIDGYSIVVNSSLSLPGDDMPSAYGNFKGGMSSTNPRIHDSFVYGSRILGSIIEGDSSVKNASVESSHVADWAFVGNGAKVSRSEVICRSTVSGRCHVDNSSVYRGSSVCMESKGRYDANHMECEIVYNWDVDSAGYCCVKSTRIAKSMIGSESSISGPCSVVCSVIAKSQVSSSDVENSIVSRSTVAKSDVNECCMELASVNNSSLSCASGDGLSVGGSFDPMKGVVSNVRRLYDYVKGLLCCDRAYIDMRLSVDMANDFRLDQEGVDMVMGDNDVIDRLSELATDCDHAVRMEQCSIQCQYGTLDASKGVEPVSDRVFVDCEYGLDLLGLGAKIRSQNRLAFNRGFRT